MKKIEDLAYLLKEAKKRNQPQPIFFLGAGASKTGNIPLANEIIKDILERYSDMPSIQNLPVESSYADLMHGLEPFQRKELLKGYIDNAKINVAHIYLAQLLKENFVDYILTVNFDNLMLRALSMFNIFPATYDMAIIRELTTTTFEEKSVVYLHGQSHGLWQLNTDEEMKKVEKTIPKIFDTIKNRRPWVFIGYSGNDPILQHIKNLGRFDNGLYWVSYYDESPRNEVFELLSDPNTNGNLIKGYDADSFMLKLNSLLGLEQPDIVNKPFSALKEMLDNIVDIDDKEHFKNVKERMEISLRHVSEAIDKYEEGKIEQGETKEKMEIDLLKKDIINIIISGKYDDKKISQFEEKATELGDENLNYLLSGLYNNWGTDLGGLAKTRTGQESEDLYSQSFAKYQKAVEIKPDDYEAYNNWGIDLGDLAKTKTGQESEDLFSQSFAKFQRAVEIKPDFHEAYNNWGTDLGALAKTKTGQESEDLFSQSFAKFQKAVELGGDCYNLACWHALRKNKDNALSWLEESLKRQEITTDFVLTDEDWLNYLQDEDFLRIIDRSYQ